MCRTQLHEKESEMINMDFTVMNIIHGVEFQTMFLKGRRPVAVFNKGILLLAVKLLTVLTGVL
jgi:hypothetical protein